MVMSMIMIICHVYIFFRARVDEIPWCDQSNEICGAASGSAVLLRTMQCIVQRFTNKMR